jgi:hypothetical protein
MIEHNSGPYKHSWKTKNRYKSMCYILQERNKPFRLCKIGHPARGTFRPCQKTSADSLRPSTGVPTSPRTFFCARIFRRATWLLRRCAPPSLSLYTLSFREK